ncbi:hypothetical protein ABK040_007756 [Willaertia magna]
MEEEYNKKFNEIINVCNCNFLKIKEENEKLRTEIYKLHVKVRNLECTVNELQKCKILVDEFLKNDTSLYDNTDWTTDNNNNNKDDVN